MEWLWYVVPAALTLAAVGVWLAHRRRLRRDLNVGAMTTAITIAAAAGFLTKTFSSPIAGLAVGALVEVIRQGVEYLRRVSPQGRVDATGRPTPNQRRDP